MKFVKNCKTFALTAALALLLSGCGPSHEEVVAAVGRSMETGLQAEFAAYEFEERHFGDGLIPVTVFAGKNAKILAATKPAHRSELMGLGTLQADGLAITKSGRYFAFTYTSALQVRDMRYPFVSTPCLAPDCRYLSNGHPLSREAAMKWLYHSAIFTPELFQEVFGEEAPPKRVDA